MRLHHLQASIRLCLRLQPFQRFLPVPGNLLCIAFLLAEDAAAVFLHVKAQFPGLLLPIPEAGAEIPVQEGNAQCRPASSAV